MRELEVGHERIMSETSTMKQVDTPPHQAVPDAMCIRYSVGAVSWMRMPDREGVVLEILSRGPWLLGTTERDKPLYRYHGEHRRAMRPPPFVESGGGGAVGALAGVSREPQHATRYRDDTRARGTAAARHGIQQAPHPRNKARGPAHAGRGAGAWAVPQRSAAAPHAYAGAIIHIYTQRSLEGRSRRPQGPSDVIEFLAGEEDACSGPLPYTRQCTRMRRRWVRRGVGELGMPFSSNPPLLTTGS